MKKLFLCLTLILSVVWCLPLSNNIVFAESVSVKIIVNECSIYQDADTTSPVYQTKIPHKTVLDAEDYNEKFYLITYQSQTGYILKIHTMLEENSSPKKTLVFNAKIIKDSNIYKLENDRFEDTYFDKLTSGTEIRLVDGYNKDNDYTLISYYDEQGNILTYYIETQNIQVYGIPKTVFIAISLIIFSVSIIFILFGTKIKKQKR